MKNFYFCLSYPKIDPDEATKDITRPEKINISVYKASFPSKIKHCFHKL